MAEFFNKKEEVLDVQLTEHGEFLLSIGRLKPAYYSFFDDDILYDRRAAVSSSAEIQKDIDRRIRYETPSIKPPSTITSAQDRVGEWVTNVGDIIINKESNSAAFINSFDLPQPQQYINGFSAEPIGTSDLKSEYAPAWKISCLSNEISSSQPYTSSDLEGNAINTVNCPNCTELSGAIIKEIPQIDITINYETYYQTRPEDEGILELVNDQLGIGEIYLAVKDDYLTLQIDELNTNFEKENFDIEVYYKEAVGSGYEIQQLQFANPDSITPTSVGYVEQYINVYVDDEIPEQVINDLALVDKSLSLSAQRLRLNRDLYDDNESTAPCEDPTA